MVHNVIVIALVLGLFLALCCVSEDDDESAAMAKLAEGFNPKPLHWTTNPTSSVCLWQGVSCTDRALGNVLYIILRNVSLSGFVSSPFPPLPHLRMLDLSNNNLSGEIPSFANLQSLQVLLLKNNRFSSMTHDFFFGLPPSIITFEVSDNPFLLPWTIPKEFSRLKNLTGFYSQNASVTGTLPDIFQSSSSLVTLSLSYNSLNGSLPQSFRDAKIQVLELAHQKMKFTGTIQVISSMFTLSYLDLEGNQFTGPIPDLSKCKKLEAMLLGNNLLTGLVPTSLASFKGLKNISLSNNKLQGPLPTFLSLKAQHLYVLLDGNNFCTSNYTSHCDEQVDALLEMAGAFGYPLRLSDAWKGNDACLNWAYVRCNSRREIVMIDMGKQYFGGTMSPAFSKLRSLQYLYLNDNNLTGVIPKTLLDLPNLKLLDVSNNDLFGDIPSFKSSVKLITTGNPQLRNVASAKEEKSKMIITIVAIVVIITCGICIYLTGRKTKRHAAKVENMDEFSKSEARLRELNLLLKEEGEMKLQDFQMISFAELVNATDSFHETNKLGQGGFGSVYKGKLEDGQEIAVKRLSNASRQGLEEFMNEVVVISKLQHKNLVRLLGCCITDEEKLLVYEYMPNKSLDAFLFDHEKQKVLDWEKRYKIIRGISRGLLYLHLDSRLRIIHRDLKASNILLDKYLNPKISDFGMARIFGANEDHANTKRVMGTYGYMPPEYVMEGRFSERSDIFSFGVLILEIASGRRNLRPGDDKGLSLLELVWTLWKDNSISTLIDPVISNSDSNEEILRCIHVGLLCVQDLVKDRPTISMVISMLGSEIEDLPTPKEPLFLAKQDTKNQSQSSSDLAEMRVNGNGVSLIMDSRQ